MRDRYVYRWGFAWRVSDPGSYQYVFRWGFVWRVKRASDDIYGWTSYRVSYKTQLPVRWRPGQIISCDSPSEYMDYVAFSTAPMFVRRKG